MFFGPVKNVHDASKITLKYTRIFPRGVQNVHDASKNVHGALKAESAHRKYSRIFSTLQKYVHSFWTRPKRQILSGKSA